jgi:hypothetical protein
MSPTQVVVVFRDICKAINYQSCDKEIAYSTSSSVISSGWSDLPEWVGVVELQLLENEVKLTIEVSSEIAPMDYEKVLNTLSKEVNEIFNYKIHDFPYKVFCIGWPKTGTTSITQALRILGFFSWHYSPWVMVVIHLVVMSQTYLWISNR